MQIRWLAGLLGLVLVVGAAGCAAFQVPEEPPKPAPLAPVWDQKELREHLRYLNGSETQGRMSGTPGYARAAAYVTARLREFRLQPVLGDEFRVLYGAPLNHVRSAALTATGVDSLFFLPGVEFLPDGRTDSGRVAVSSVRFVPAEAVRSGVAPPVAPRTALVVATGVPTAWLESARDRGVPAVLIAGALVPSVSAEPVRGLLVTQITTAAAAALLETTPAAVPRLIEAGGTRRLSRTVTLRIVADVQPRAGAINVMGYVAGKHPAHADELVIVCSDLDAAGQVAGTSIVDLEHFGVETAALLELARNFSYVSRRWTMPDRTLLFAVWSGARTGMAGLRAFLKQPTWDLERATAVVYVGLSPEEEPAVRALLAEHGLPLYAVPAPDEPLAPQPAYVIPEAAVQRMARQRGIPAAESPSLNLSEIMDKAMLHAVALSEAAYPVVLRAATGMEPLPPRPDEPTARSN